MALTEVDENSIETILNAAFEKGETVILKFGSEWCEPCHALEGELEEIDEEHEDVSVLMVDTDESQELAAQYSIRQLPTMLIFRKRDELIYRGEGVLLASDIMEIVRS